jgi:uncharacterized protein (DUF885 family)
VVIVVKGAARSGNMRMARTKARTAMFAARGIGLAIAGASLLCAAPGRADPAPPPLENINRLADAWLDLNADHLAPDRLPDLSARSRGIRERSSDAILSALLRIDPARLDELDTITYEMLRESLEASRDVRSCHREFWNIDHISGWHVAMPRLAARQPVGTAESRRQAIARWSGFPAFVDAEIALLDQGLRRGYSTPASIVLRVVQQLDGLLALPVEDSPYMSPAKRDGDPRFGSAFAALVKDRINPSLARYRDYLRGIYRPRARTTIAVSALPNGKACYAALLRQETTLKTSPRSVFERGLRLVETNRAEIAAAGRSLLGISDVPAIMARIGKDPSNRFESADAVLAFSRRAVERNRRLAAASFLDAPSDPLEVEPFAAYQRNSGMNPYYSPAAGDGQAARYYINLDTWRDNSKSQAEVTTAHEAWPGHHLQVSVARKLEYRNRFAKAAVYGAYVEGWARYAERLADETGLYESPYARIVWRAKPGFGMVVDPGVHMFGWSRAKAAAFLKGSGLFGGDQAVEDMIDRITVMPAQLTAYDSGGLEFLALRDLARASLGQAFDLRQFHRQVLGYGIVPLSTLHKLTTAWIVRQRESAAGGAGMAGKPPCNGKGCAAAKFRGP